MDRPNTDGATEEVPLFRVPWGRDEIQNAVDSITRGGYWAKGPYVDAFERALVEYHEAEHAVVVNSGTTAIETALEASGIGPGDEVVVPSFTIVSTVNAIVRTGATPVFADVERETYGLDPDHVRALVTPETAAVLPVHCYGLPCKLEPLRRIADDHDLTLVQDAAEAQGATVSGRPVESFGDVVALSFCQNKVVAAGEGGAVLTDDDAVAAAAREIRDHGRPPGEGVAVRAGTNYRLSDLNAAVGCAQMDRIESLIRGRRRVAARLVDGIADVEGVALPPHPDDRTHVFQFFTTTLASGVDRDAVQRELADRGIASKSYWPVPVHRHEYCEGLARFDRASLPVTEDLSDRVLSLPIHPRMRDETADRVVAALAAAVAAA